VLTSYGDPSLYERALAIRKQVALDKVTAEGFRDRAAIVNEQSNGIQAEADAAAPQTRAERREAEQERERADQRAQAQTLEEQERMLQSHG